MLHPEATGVIKDCGESARWDESGANVEGIKESLGDIRERGLHDWAGCWTGRSASENRR